MLLLVGCTDLASPYADPRSADQFYVPTDVIETAQAAMTEWSAFGFHFSTSTEKPSDRFFSEIRIVDRVCADWPDTPENAIGCAYAVRPGPVLDSAMAARAHGDSLSYTVEIQRGANIRKELIHELGHVAGFCHVTGPVIMNAVENAADNLTPDDLANPCVN